MFLTVLISAMTISASWNFKQNNNEIKLSNLALANVEALADNEGTTTSCSNKCSEGGGKCWYKFSGHCYYSANTNVSCTCDKDGNAL